MKIYDISQEVFGCRVYPGDASPKMIAERRMEEGEVYNLTSFSMNAHNGTHVDAPFHFIKDGDTIDKMPLEKTVGLCYVTEYKGRLTAAEAEKVITAAGEKNEESAGRILLKGDALVTEESAAVFAREGTLLVGVESQSVGPEDAPMAVHKILLGAGTALLEGLCLKDVPEGVYLLSAVPLNLAGSDGAPCRAVLIDM